MNTLDFKHFNFNTNNWLKEVLEKQTYILNEYLKYEKMEISDFDINLYEDQQKLKDFLQIRFVEELTEATLDRDNPDHFLEEIVDAFNFLIESYIIYGNINLKWKIDIKSNFIDIKRDDKIFKDFYILIESVGKACNFLKNRPWKQSQYLVDLIPFEVAFMDIFNKFNELCNKLGITPELLFKTWSLKYQVNLYRIKSKY